MAELLVSDIYLGDNLIIDSFSHFPHVLLQNSICLEIWALRSVASANYCICYYLKKTILVI